MGKKAKTAIVLALLLIIIWTLAFDVRPAKSDPTTIIVPDDYPTIQEAINAASPSDTIMVKSGTYQENIEVNTTVTIIGEDTQTTIIDGNQQGTTILITAQNVSLTELTIRNSNYTWPHGGIYISDASHCNISNTVITNNWVGIWLEDSSNNTLSDLTVTNNRYGIWLVRSNNTILSNTTTTNNTKYGVWLEDSSNNTLTNLTIINNEFGIQLEESHNNTIYNNQITNNTHQIASIQSTNIWDNGYPSGGNYWSDYTGVDLKSSPNQDQLGSDGIGDTSYIIDANNTDRYPLMNPNAIHDIAITNITPSKTIIGQGFSLYINIQATNEGNRLETTNITVQINTTILAQTVNLTLGTNTITFTWNTTTQTKGSYTITANSPQIPGETDTADNSLEYNGTVAITVPGDTDGDRDIDIYDIVRLASIYGTKRGEARFNPNCDIDSNGEIDIYDVVIAASSYGYKET